MLLIYKSHNNKKNVLASLHLIAKVNATLTPQKAHSLVWNRTVNNGGGARKNISLDLRMEHIVHLHKEILSNLGVNLTPEAALRCSKAVIGTLRYLHQQIWTLSDEVHLLQFKHKSGLIFEIVFLFPKLLTQAE